MRKSRGFDPPLSAAEIAFYESSCWFPEHFMDTRGALQGPEISSQALSNSPARGKVREKKNHT